MRKGRAELKLTPISYNGFDLRGAASWTVEMPSARNGWKAGKVKFRRATRNSAGRARYERRFKNGRR